MQKNLILYIAMSLDGFIAKEDGNLDWLTKYNNNSEDYGFKALYDRVGTVFVGGATYRQVEDTYKDKEAYIFTRMEPKQTTDNIHFVHGDVKEIVNNFKLVDNRDIWLVGGGNLVSQFLKEDLIDEYIITIIPILLGKGISLFYGNYSEIGLKLQNVKHYGSGLVQLHYVKH